MLLKVSVLVVAVFVQVNGQYKQPYGYGASMQSFQMWDPSKWDASWDYSKWAPYVEAASKMWMDYFKQAMQQPSPQSYNQWDKTRSADIYGTGMNFAQQMAKEAQNQAEEAMKQAQGAVPKF